MSHLERTVLDDPPMSGVVGLDQLSLVRLPFVPEVRLHLAVDPIIFGARMEAERGTGLAPFWASAWAGGQAVSRYVLDHPEVVAGRRVLDLGAGSGLVAIAAAVAGAAAVTANDIDPYARAAATLNARANGVVVHADGADLLGGDGAGAEVVLVGDLFYDGSLAARVLAFVERAAGRGARVLVGDPGRAYLPHGPLEVVARYEVSMMGPPQDAELNEVYVLQPRG
ncbi:class I SAM-dependent methyltransferase [Planosporangium mesophilum]|uniref:50S ribosomal protein L11 methyltransferase n=1 Tax=Planosporangium mesophilum TaxID=689768 RepID=A0A8J3WYQ7_9ACTN|nr:methyltransferase [Planosporangium mesophilum]GII21442.1 50S ribosomal protein L11 methyltransferase [Planosporangium mesophilum]